MLSLKLGTKEVAIEPTDFFVAQKERHHLSVRIRGYKNDQSWLSGKKIYADLA